MQGGDLSNARPWRWVITWEEGIARLPQRSQRAYQWASAGGFWGVALDYWKTEPHAVHVLTDLAVRMGRQFDVVTHLGTAPKLVRKLEDRLEFDGVPASRVEAMSRDDFQQALVYRPDVVAVVHGGSPFAYGTRGIHVDDPALLQRLL